MHVTDFIEMLSAAHLSHRVASPFEERGGLMLVGPPGTMKSSFLGELDTQYHDALTLTDLNAKSLVQLRDRIAAGSINTLVFPEYGKIYERKDDTAMNLEGAIRALVQEGFTAAAFENSGINRLHARAMVIGALTPTTQSNRSQGWEESGFSRRFLWVLYRLENPDLLEESILEWRRLRVRAPVLPQLPSMNEKIPNNTTRSDREVLRRLVKYQPGGSATQHLQLLTKMLAVLQWWYDLTGNPRNPLEVMESFGVLLGKGGGLIDLEPISSRAKRRTRERDAATKLTTAARVLSKESQRKQVPKKGGKRR